jgi:cysteine desulfurase family protein (TIGR01976 family)
LDLRRIRSEFPALAGDWIFLDNAGGSQVLRRVADRIHDYLLTTSVQLGASYAVSRNAAERVLAARRTIARLINAEHDEEVVIGGSTTSLMFMLAQAIAPGVRPGDEIVVTQTDHEANIGAWTRLQQYGAVIKIWPVNRDSLELELSDLDLLLRPKVTWVAMTHASNVLGRINPVAEVARRVHAAGARLCVDAVAYAPHRLVDVQQSGADVYVFSFYKVFGPHLAVLWGRREVLLPLPGLNHYFIGADELPYKLQPGNVNYELSYGCIGIADYLTELGMEIGTGLGADATDGTDAPDRAPMQRAFDAFAAHEDALAEQLLGYLRGKPAVRVIGPPRVIPGERVPTVSFVVKGMRPDAIVPAIDRYGIGIRHGDFYARRLIEALELDAAGGVVRVSIAHYNTADEIGRLTAALEEVLP